MSEIFSEKLLCNFNGCSWRKRGFLMMWVACRHGFILVDLKNLVDWNLGHVEGYNMS